MWEQFSVPSHDASNNRKDRMEEKYWRKDTVCHNVVEYVQENLLPPAVKEKENGWEDYWFGGRKGGGRERGREEGREGEREGKREREKEREGGREGGRERGHTY